MRLLLNELELEAMSELPLLARCVYVFGIRPHMDYATGLAGVKRGISWQSLAESCYVDHHQGRQDSGTPHKSRVRRAVAVLESEGLVRVSSRGKQLVIECLLAERDTSAQKKPDRRPTHVRHTKADSEADTSEAAPLGGFREEGDTQPDRRPTHHEHTEPDTPPESGIRSKDSPPKGGSSRKKESAREPVITLPLNDNTEHPITPEQRNEWQELYPAVDVDQALRSMRAWCLENPAKRKTRRGIGRFVVGWLERDQNRGGNVAVAKVRPLPTGRNRQQALEERNRQVAASWQPPELRRRG